MLESSNPLIMITGETAGTGASTTAKLLGKLLNLPVITGGKYLRALAYSYKHFREDHPEIAEDQQYPQFLQRYQKTFQEQGLQKTNRLFIETLGLEPRSDILAEFQAAIEKNQQHTNETDTIWDYLVDLNTLSEALTSNGCVWEAKLAILSLKIDQLQPAINATHHDPGLFIQVLLVATTEHAAQRVAEREHRQVSIEEIELRKKRDFGRYTSMYTIHGKPIEHTDLRNNADYILETDIIPPQQVAKQILEHYIQKIQAQMHHDQSALITKLQTAVQAL